VTKWADCRSSGGLPGVWAIITFMVHKTSFSGRDLGIDLGTANSLIYVRGSGIALDEPSVVAVNAVTGEVISVGSEAKRVIGRTPAHIVALRPLRDGVIADFEAAERMLGYFIRKVSGRGRFSRPRVVISVPCGITGVERRAVIEAALSAGVRQVHLVDKPMAAAIGAGLPVNEPEGSMIVDIGAGTTEVAVVSMGGLVAARSVRIAGDAIDAALTTYVKRHHALAIGERTAEQVKMTLGTAADAVDGYWPEELRGLDRELAQAVEINLAGEVRPADEAVPKVKGVESDDDREGTIGVLPGAGVGRSTVQRCRIRGRDHVSGLPKVLDLDAEQVHRAIADPVEAIVSAVRHTLDECPPELVGDIMDRGIVLSGGGALLRGMDARIANELDVPVLVAEQPLECVAVGTGRCVENFSALKRVLDAQFRPYVVTRA
jgi:rod shape-determining protein MreB and related proteins